MAFQIKVNDNLTIESFSKKRCRKCGEKLWNGNESGFCTNCINRKRNSKLSDEDVIFLRKLGISAMEIARLKHVRLNSVYLRTQKLITQGYLENFYLYYIYCKCCKKVVARVRKDAIPREYHCTGCGITGLVKRQKKWNGSDNISFFIAVPSRSKLGVWLLKNA